ncbi:MAG: hypothetical protein ACRDOK_17355 [Streptosporangiaceae bacterium]
MIALLRYQEANLFRSHRWIFPLIVYVLLIAVGGTDSSPAARSAVELARIEGNALACALDWSATILVPVIALLTRSMLTAEPAAARACVAVARGPARAQLATLLVAFAGGVVLGLAGACYELATNGHHTALLMPFFEGLGKALVCVLVGSAVGTLFNPPLIRHAAAALLGTLAAVVVALVSSVSPASAALRGNGATVQAAAWPTGLPVLAAFALAVASWTASCWLAGRRGEAT